MFFIGRNPSFANVCYSTDYAVPFARAEDTQQPRLRTICVDIAHSFIWRNIDAHLLREHSVRRYCVKYKCLQKFANLTYGMRRRKRPFWEKKYCIQKKLRMRKKYFGWIRSYDHQVSLR